MNIRCAFILLLIAMSGGYSYAGQTDTVPVRSVAVPVVKIDSAALKASLTPKVKTDTATVRSYEGVPVFFHCKPLHKYTRLGYMTRSTLVSYLSTAFDRYAKIARKHVTGHLGIIIDDANFGVDSFDVVRFAPEDGRSDTALFTVPIFVSARPTRPYRVIKIIKDELGAGSLNSNLQGYLKHARDLNIPFDGIMLRDVSYGFSRDNIFMFRWRKNAVAPAAPVVNTSPNTASKP